MLLHQFRLSAFIVLIEFTANGCLANSVDVRVGLGKVGSVSLVLEKHTRSSPDGSE